MRKYLLLLLIPFLILSCTTEKFKFSANVDAKVIGATNNYIGIQYEVYGKTVFQDIHIPTFAELSYYSKMKTIPLTVFVEGDDYDGGDRILITLTHNGSLFGDKQERYRKLSISDFIPKDLEIPGFAWYIFNEKEYSDGISAKELRVKLAKDGDKPPEEIIKEKEKKTGGDKKL